MKNSNEDVITKLFENNHNNQNGIIILLHGPWGSGKTYRFNESIKNKTKNKKYIYISLYDIASITDLKSSILNKYLNKSIYKRFSFWVLNTIIIALIFFTFYYFQQDSVHSLIKIGGVFLVSIFILSIWSINNIFLHFTEKLMGLNVNNISIKRIYNPSKFIFCFDDFDRTQDNLHKQLLGFFHKLAKEDGFNILIIDRNSTEKDSENNGVEKVFDYDFEHQLEDIPAEVISHTLCPEVHKVFESFRERLFAMFIAKHEYDDDTQEKIHTTHSNLRLFGKISNNISVINEKLSTVENKHPIKETTVIEYIFLLTIAINLKCSQYFATEHARDQLHHDNYLLNVDGEDTKKNLWDFFANLTHSRYYYIYPQIYKEISSGNSDIEALRLEVRDTYEQLTEFEKLYVNSQGISFPSYRTGDFYQLIGKWEETIKQTKPLFSSLSMMKNSLTGYIQLMGYLGTESTCLNIIKEAIFEYAQSNFLDLIDNSNAAVIVDRNIAIRSELDGDKHTIINNTWIRAIICAGLRYYRSFTDTLQPFSSYDFKDPITPKMEILLILLLRSHKVRNKIFDLKNTNSILYTDLMFRIIKNIKSLNNIWDFPRKENSHYYQSLSDALLSDMGSYAKLGIVESRLAYEFAKYYNREEGKEIINALNNFENIKFQDKPSN